jgi:TonB-linked SusC/RagA family outer membrane protein
MTETSRNFVFQRYKFLLVLSCLTLYFVNSGATPVGNYPGETVFQQVVIKGVVTDEIGNIFPYVTVYVDGNTAIGTTTNEKGEYQLTVPPNSTLCFAFVGYKTKKQAIGNNKTISVQMDIDVQVIDEVVVVGFTQQNKANVSISVTTIKADQLMQSPVANVTNALAGRLPGLTTIQSGGQPGLDAATLYVRGQGTWNNSEPLYVIDGVERNKTLFSTMDPSEIESFSVLKDAAATAVYGSKGANGVVLITTKRGQQGTPSITFSTSTTLQQFTRYPDYLESAESLELYNEALRNDGNSPIYSETDIEKFRTGEDPYRYPNTDWYAMMMKKVAPQYNASLNVRGGSRTVKYFFSGSYMKQQGQLKTSQGRVYDPEFAYSRYRFTSNLDAEITKNFTLSVEAGGSLADRSDPQSQLDVFTYMNRMSPWSMPSTNPDGSYAGTAEFPDVNPMYMLQTQGNEQRLRSSITSSVKLDFKLGKFIKGLSADVRMAYDSYFGNGKYWTETQSTFQLISRSGRADRYRSYLQPKYFGSTTDQNEAASRTVDALANIIYSRKFSDHSIRVQGIANIATRRETTELPYNSVSFIARFNYTYKRKYNLEANASYRGSENFAPGNRFGLFPSLSASWNIHEESFMKNVKFINLLKFRASYGMTGNDFANTRFIYNEGKWTTGTTAYAYFGYTNGASNGYSLEPSIANPLATWETAEQINIGGDLALLKNRISLSFDRFFEKRDGILQTPRSVSGSLGIGVPDMNIGKTSRQGWELEVTYTQKMSRNIELSVRPNIAYTKNKVVFRDEPAEMEWWLKEEGKPIGRFLGYQVLGFFHDQSEIDNSPVQQVGSAPIPGDLRYMDYNNDGVVNTYDRVPIGYTNMPRITFGTSFGVTYKALDVNIHFQGATQSSVFISNYLMYEFYNRGKVQSIHLGRWTPETAETATYPALHIGAISQNHVTNSFFLKDNSYIRLKTIEVAYNFSQSAVKKLGMKGLRVYFSGINLITWDNLKVVDPETATGSTSGIYPQSKNYSFGITINF